MNTATVQFGVGDGAPAFNHTDTSGNYAFAPVINGLGTLIQVAGWTNLTADSSGFTGQTHVNGGRLAVNGSLANSAVDVNSGGIAGRQRNCRSYLGQRGRHHCPGNSIGTLNINGNISFSAGSIYQVEVNPAGNADRISASGHRHAQRRHSARAGRRP